MSRGMQIRLSFPFFRQIRRSANILLKSEITTTFGNRSINVRGKLINVSAIVNFAHIVKRETTSVLISLVRKRDNVDEIINLPTKAEESSMIQISFRTQDPNRQEQSGIRAKIRS